MEGVNNETRYQIFMNFYQKNQAKRELYTIHFFSTFIAPLLELNVEGHSFGRKVPGCHKYGQTPMKNR